MWIFGMPSGPSSVDSHMRLSWYGRVSPYPSMYTFHWPGRVISFLKSAPKSALSMPRVRAAAGVYLVAVAARELVFALAYVTESRNVHAGRASAPVVPVQQAGVTSRRAAAIVVIHEIVAQLAAVIAKALRESG